MVTRTLSLLLFVTVQNIKAGKKDAVFISDIFMGIVSEYDENSNHVDLFYFDGALNVKKAGEVLEVKYLRTFAYHSGEHVVALWFTSLAQIPETKVCFFVMFSVLFYCFV